jgi:hypothetical protein
MMMEAVVAGPSQNPQNHGARVLLPERSATTWLSSEGEGGGERGGTTVAASAYVAVAQNAAATVAAAVFVCVRAVSG